MSTNKHVKNRQMKTKRAGKATRVEDEEIASSSDDDKLLETSTADHPDLEAEETAHEKRYRLAKDVLSQAFDDAMDYVLNDGKVDKDAVANRLEQPDSRARQRPFADYLKIPSETEVRHLKVKHMSPTCVTMSSDGKRVACGTKKGCLLMWDVETGAKLAEVPSSLRSKSEFGHDYVTTIIFTSENKYLCTGGQDKKIIVWNALNLQHVKTFQTTSPVQALASRIGRQQLFSCFADGLVKMWDLDQMGYMDEMYGHLSHVEDIDCLAKERCITCGGRDRTIRIWKAAEDSQLVYEADKNNWESIDAVSLIDESHFVSGASDGSLTLWSVLKRKPLHVERKAHCTKNKRAPWISALKSLRFTDLIVSGSNDSLIKFWKIDESSKLKQIGEFHIEGCVNGFSFNEDGSLMAVAVGQEHKRGRWWKVSHAHNAILVLPLKYSNESEGPTLIDGQ